MIKLYVDDIRVCPEGWHVARTNTDAIQILAGPLAVSEISIDHDIVMCNIGQKPFRLDILKETFRPVVHYLAIMPKGRLPKKIIIHTANPLGAQYMVGVLQEAGIEHVVNLSNPPDRDDLRNCELSEEDIQSLSQGLKEQFGD